MLKKILLMLVFSTLPLISIADEILLNESAPTTYVVVKGDTLWDISAVFLEQPWLWPKLWRLNPEISNPHLIYPGDVLRLVYDENGEPMLVVNQPETTDDGKPVVVVKEKPNLKWSPKVRTTVKGEAIEILPLHIIAPYIRYQNLFTQEQLDTMPYVIGSDEGHRSSIDNFNVYVNDNLVLAKTYGIYHKGKEIVDPETQESLGFEGVLVGTAQATALGDMENKKPGTLYVTSANREIRSSSYIIPINEGQLLPSKFTMKAADESLRGSIIQSATDGREFGKLEVIMINRGREHDVQLGDVMSIQRKSPKVIETKNGPTYAIEAARWDKIGEDDYDMPEEKIGHIMVFKLYDKTSMAIILSTEKPARLADTVTAP